jgi:outer membrane protein TolC
VDIEFPNFSKHASYSLDTLPQFIKFHLDSLSIINSRKFVDLNYRPQMNAFANAGLNAVPVVGISQAYGFSVGVNFNMPIYDGHQRNLGYKKLEFSEDTRRNYKAFLSSQYKIQLQQLDDGMKANEAIKNQLTKQRTDIQNLLDLNRQQLNTGAISITDFTINLRRLLDLQNDLNAAEIKELLLINSYNYIVW